MREKVTINTTITQLIEKSRVIDQGRTSAYFLTWKKTFNQPGIASGMEWTTIQT